jgi:hypothetical protein
MPRSIRVFIREAHRRALLDLADPIHEACDFLLPSSEYELLRLVHVNEFLHARPWDPWPELLVAFASSGRGDYFAYDLRELTAIVLYLDPDRTIAENLQTTDKLE